MSLPKRIFLALGCGALAGVTLQGLASGASWLELAVRYLTEPVGRLWLSALIMVVIPLIISTIATGVVGLGDLRHVGRLGGLTLAVFLLLTAASSTLGLVIMNLLQPGGNLPPAVQQELLARYGTEVQQAMGLAEKSFSIELLVRLLPRNPVQAAATGDMLGVIVFSLFMGMGLVVVGQERGEPLTRVLNSLAAVTVGILELVMKAAPIGVFCLIFSVAARFGWKLLWTLSSFVGTAVLGLALFQFVFYPLVLWLVARRNPWEFFRQIRLVLVTAFSTSSSNATLPTTMRTAEEGLGISREVSAFVLPLGATMNMNGTALFEGATVLFLAQVFGICLSVQAQLLVVLLSVLTAVGTAGVPGGSIPLLAMVLGMVGVPPEGIAVVLGVDRFLDMCRTTLNVTGDLVTALVVERWSWHRFETPQK